MMTHRFPFIKLAHALGSAAGHIYSHFLTSAYLALMYTHTQRHTLKLPLPLGRDFPLKMKGGEEGRGGLCLMRVMEKIAW